MSAKTCLKSICFHGALLAAGGTFLVAPGRAAAEKKKPFLGRTFAHRGLYTEDQLIPENSLAAFEAAAQAEYGIELDIQLTKDGKIVVFHDHDLSRMCGVPARIDELGAEELRAYTLATSGEKIPLFSEVLSLVDGRVPLLVELKSAGARNVVLCQKAVQLLSGYHGTYCVESFDPRIVRWFRKFAPWILRGQLVSGVKSFIDDGVSPAGAQILAQVGLNFLGRPEFIACEIGQRSAGVRLSEMLGAMKVGWTSHEASDLSGLHAAVFEFYKPPRVFL